MNIRCWEYRAYNADGVIHEGVIKSYNHLAAIVKLRSRGLQVYAIKTISPAEYLATRKILGKDDTTKIGRVKISDSLATSPLPSIPPLHWHWKTIIIGVLIGIAGIISAGLWLAL